MTERESTTVDAYLATFPAEIRARLEKVRGAIRRAVPRATEGISYQIPTYKLDGALVIYFAGWSEHVAIYPANDGVAEAFAAELERYDVSKGTIRFPHDSALPIGLIGKITKFRAALALDRLAAKNKPAKKKPAKTSHK